LEVGHVKHSALTLLILQLNSLLDTGRYDHITVEEVEGRIEDGSILRFLRERAGKDIDLSYHFETTSYSNFERFYVTYLQSILNAYGGRESRKWGVQNRGLCLLIAWTNEILQQGSGWTPAPNTAGVEYS
jgi:hypothetical protein